MRSRSGNPLSTFLLALPLLAIPLMAIFGVPQFVPVIASSVHDSKVTLERAVPRRSAGVGESALPSSHRPEQPSRDRSAEERLDDLFQLTDRSRQERQPARRSQPERPTSFGERSSLTATTAAMELVESKPDKKFAELFGTDEGVEEVVKLQANNRPESRTRARPPTAISVPAQPVALPFDSSAEGLTWRQAVRRLNELGIQQFRLEPGHDRGDFYFACEFSPDGNPRIKRRFEAEAPEPLQAVELVLGQIDDWTSSGNSAGTR